MHYLYNVSVACLRRVYGTPTEASKESKLDDVWLDEAQTEPHSLSLHQRGATTGAETAEDWCREVTWSCWGKTDGPAVCGEKLHMRTEARNEWVGLGEMR